MSNKTTPELVTFGEGCALMCIALQTGYNLFSQGGFPVPVYKSGRRSLLRLDEIKAYLDSLPETPAYQRRRTGPKRGRPRNHLIP